MIHHLRVKLHRLETECDKLFDNSSGDKEEPHQKFHILIMGKLKLLAVQHYMSPGLNPFAAEWLLNCNGKLVHGNVS